MNSHQRRKLSRRAGSASQARLVQDWSELAEVSDSATHSLEIDVESGNGWIKDKINEDAFGRYLSTHTFYGSNHKYSTRLLRSCGFNVTLANWDGIAPASVETEAGEEAGLKQNA